MCILVQIDIILTFIYILQIISYFSEIHQSQENSNQIFVNFNNRSVLDIRLYWLSLYRAL